MGQQQLLLIILVTIIVGIATVVAINIFGTSAASANEDAVRQDVLVIASSAQGWYIKPKMMGGGDKSFSGLTFRKFNFPTERISGDGITAENMNGIYVINTDAGNSFTVTAHPSSCEGYSAGASGSTDPGSGGCADPLTATVEQNNIDWSDIEEGV